MSDKTKKVQKDPSTRHF